MIKDSIAGKNPVETQDDDNNYTFFSNLWTIEQMELVNNLFTEADSNNSDSESYLDAIENIVSIKVRCAKEILVKNMQTIT